MKLLPPNILKCLSEDDRKSLGKAGMLPDEAIAKQVAKSEKELQSQIVSLLRLKGVEVLWHRTDKKSAATVGWPDLTFCVRLGCDDYGDTIACAYEVKIGDGQLSEEQKRMHEVLIRPPNGWRVRVVRSVQEVLKDLKDMGL